ncbi:LysM peptidoglycan-binding domain-containing protein [Microbacterium sp. LRZ72]|uniref:LysM peptidoglycan-binding domain-containing protein n=1 Tax=Microbacterium sp. LRZ72 TaxID=2942481 RepID=UPI0029A1E2C8|nr:LysM peptidoglycan-binding domain-containing protein [Microbacterium sp. LRZ72]MDX2375715.1 LysM peptidoglycan-binding domain-containing protein [Microbacterium sp. LRZ72]
MSVALNSVALAPIASRHAASRPTPAARTRLRLTARGRRGLAALTIVVVAALLVLGALGAQAAMASATDPAASSATAALGSSSFETVTVQSGESLWSIAASVAPGADPRDVIDEIVRLNALESVVVDAGQKLAIPADIRP